MECVRTCLVCRTKAQKNELCRFVRANDGEICFDEKGELPSRGAWLCGKKACLMKGFQKRLLFRGERTLPMNAEDMLSFVSKRVKGGALSRLGLLRRLGHIEMGREAVLRMAAKGGDVCAVVIARDFSKRSIDELLGKMPKENAPPIVESPFLMDELGLSLGRRKTGVVALLRSRITEEVLQQLDKLKKLEH